MNDQSKPSFFQKYKWYILGIGAIILFNVFTSNKNTSKNSTPEKTVELVEKVEPTSGVITHIKEIKKDDYKIVDEKVVPTKAESRVIAEHLDGTIDTFTMDEVMMVENDDNNHNNNQHRRSGGFYRGLAYGGMMGYVFGGRSWGSPLSRGSYANDRAYQSSSTTGRQRMRSTANVKTTRKSTSSGRSGYGSGRSTRSYGG